MLTLQVFSHGSWIYSLNPFLQLPALPALSADGLHVVVKANADEDLAAVVHPAVGDPGWTEYDKDKYTVFLYTKEATSVALALEKLLRLSCQMLAQEWAKCTDTEA